MTTLYNKLVRDNIPKIIKENGAVPYTHTASDAEYINALQYKLHEEVNEFLTDLSAEECADVFEVLHAICAYKEIDMQKVENVRKQKFTSHGGFSKRIILEKTD